MCLRHSEVNQTFNILHDVTAFIRYHPDMILHGTP
jgi:hypothetical protein